MSKRWFGVSLSAHELCAAVAAARWVHVTSTVHRRPAAKACGECIFNFDALAIVVRLVITRVANSYRANPKSQRKAQPWPVPVALASRVSVCHITHARPLFPSFPPTRRVDSRPAGLVSRMLMGPYRPWMCPRVSFPRSVPCLQACKPAHLPVAPVRLHILTHTASVCGRTRMQGVMSGVALEAIQRTLSMARIILEPSCRLRDEGLSCELKFGPDLQPYALRQGGAPVRTHGASGESHGSPQDSVRLLLHIELLEEGRPADLHLDTYVGEPMLGGVKLGPCAINLSDDGLTEGLGRSRGKARFKW